MKKIFALYFLGIISTACSSDDDNGSSIIVEPEIENGLYDLTMTHNGLVREYLLFVPQNYSASQALPLVFSLHGAGGTKESQYQLSEFNEIADRENFLLVTPEAIAPRGNFTFWNQLSSANGADDVGFIDTLISLVAMEYSVDLDRVYLAGSSNGAFMSFQYVCEHSNKIAGVAAVKGYMLADQISNCQPTLPTAIIQMHGTKDPLVSYEGVQATLDFWNGFNQTDTIALTRNLPDTDPNTGNTGNSSLYQNGSNGVQVEYIKVVNGLHDWFGETEINYDLQASEEAWAFFNKFDINGLR
tara:strand:- start:5490 stop:6389 length:900 start_codon:yes stop_codon:yes gene_type:complete